MSELLGIHAEVVSDADDEQSGYKRALTALSVAIGLLAALVGLMQFQASGEADVTSRASQAYAAKFSGLATQSEAQYALARELETAQVLADRRASERRLFGDLAQTEIIRSAATQSFEPFSALLIDPQYRISGDPYSPLRFIADVTAPQEEAALRQLVTAEESASWGQLASRFSVILAILAGAAALVTLAIAAERNPYRMIFAVPGGLLVLLCSLMALSADDDRPTRVRSRAIDHVSEGLRLLKAGEYDASVKALDDAERTDPDYWPLYMIRAQSRWFGSSALDPRTPYFDALDAEVLDDVLNDAEEAIKRGGENDVYATTVYGAALIHAGEYDRAANLNDRAIRLNPDLAATWVNRFIIEAGRNSRRSTAAAWDDAVRLIQREPNAAFRESLFATTRALLQEVRTINPDANELVDDFLLIVTREQIDGLDVPESGSPAVTGLTIAAAGPRLEVSATGTSAGGALAVWYFRPEGSELWRQPYGMNRWVNVPGDGSIFRSGTNNGACPLAGDYRVELWSRNELIASGATSILRSPAEPLLPYLDGVAGVSLCYPEDWILATPTPGEFSFSSPDGRSSVSADQTLVSVSTDQTIQQVADATIAARAPVGYEAEFAPTDFGGWRVGRYLDPASDERWFAAVLATEGGLVRIAEARFPLAEEAVATAILATLEFVAT